MRLSEYAKQMGVCYRTAWVWFNNGKIEGAYQLPTGTIIVPNNIEKHEEYGVVLYARTSSSQNKDLLERQAERLVNYATTRGYKIKKVVKEFGSGLNDERKKLAEVLKDGKYDKIIVEHKDRLTRFGFNWLQLLTDNRIEVVNESEQKDEDITRDLISVIHCFSARIYGLRRSQRLNDKVKDTIKELEEDDDNIGRTTHN